MSAEDRIAALEAQARENKEQIEVLGHTNWLLSNCNIQQQTELSGFKEDFHNLHLNLGPEVADTPHKSLQARPILFCHPLTDRLYPPPGPPPTPFHIAAREAHQLDLYFMIPGFKGETLELHVDSVDLAFILQQKLRRSGWSDVMTNKGVEDFLQVPMVKVAWTGEEGKFGRLQCTQL
jgi:hypothetical protein